MDRRQIAQVGGEILSLPEQAHEILRDIVALVQEVPHNGRFPGVGVVEEDPRGRRMTGDFVWAFFMAAARSHSVSQARSRFAL